MPLPDNRRVNGPSETFQIASFLAPRDQKELTSAPKDDNNGILNSKGARKDSRMPDEIRPIYLKAGVVQRANGSAYLETSGTKLTCAVYGPRDYVKRHEFRSSGKLTCHMSFAPFSKANQRFTDIRDSLSTEYSNFITDSLVSAVCLDAYPKSQIDVYINVLEDNGNTLSYAITAASVALADAGIEMVDLVTSASLVFNRDAALLDPDANEEQAGTDGTMSLAYLPSLNKVSCLLQDGVADVARSVDLVNTCLEGCLRVHGVMKECLLRASSSLDDNGEAIEGV